MRFVSRMLSTLFRIAASIAVLACALFGTIAPARAHAELVSAEPADGVLLASSPTKLWLTFSEPVKALRLQLKLPSGEVLSLAPNVSGKTLVVDEPGSVSVGTHLLSWRVVSEDGHPISGTILFSVGRVTASAVDLGKVANAPLQLSIWLTKVVLYAALFFGIGGAFFLAFIDNGHSPAPKLLPALLWVGLVATTASLAFQGLDLLGLGFGDVFNATTWHAAWGTSYGTTIFVAAVSLITGLVSLRVSRLATARALSLVALAGVGLALAASGHASSAPPQWLTRPAVFTHGIAIAAWVGALAPLGLLLYRDRVRAAMPLKRFSRVIPVVVLLLVASGTALAIVQLDTLNGLWGTDYGFVLICKLVVVMGVFALAALNRWWFTARADQARQARNLARVVAVESLLIVVVLGLAATWRFTSPPRALALTHSTLMAHIHTEKAMAEVAIRPNTAGPVAIEINLQTDDLEPLPAKQVTVSLSLPSAGIEPLRRTAKADADGHWWIDELVIPTAGEWSLRLDILISDFRMVTMERPIKFGMPSSH
ncbi:CopD family protein [Bradyrhizobium sp. 14AA]